LTRFQTLDNTATNDKEEDILVVENDAEETRDKKIQEELNEISERKTLNKFMGSFDGTKTN